MNVYETIFIIAPTITEEERKETIEGLRSLIEDEKGEIKKVDLWGMRKLAFTVKKFNEGFYVYLLYQGLPLLVDKLEKKLRLAEEVIRYLTVKVDLKKSALEEQEAQAAAEASQ